MSVVGFSVCLSGFVGPVIRMSLSRFCNLLQIS